MKNLSIILSLIAVFLATYSFFVAPSAEAQELFCPQRGIQQITSQELESSDEPSIDDAGIFIAFERGGGGLPADQIFVANSITGDIRQLTNGSSSSNKPSISGDGTVTAFAGNSDLTGDNPMNFRQIFLANNTTGAVTQVTNITEQFTNTNDPSVNQDGTLIAFQSEFDFTGGNPDGSDEIYLLNVTTGTVIQITDTMGGGGVRGSSIKADGTQIAFVSNRNITGGNPQFRDQIFLANVTTGIITQITNVTMNSANAPSISGDGNLIAFSSNGDVLGPNPAEITQVYLFNVASGTTTQITNFDDNSREPSISANGARIAFESRAAITGPNPDEREEVYVFDIATQTFTRITNESGPGDTQSEDADINGDGTRIAFESDANINGGNPDGRDDIFLSVCREANSSFPIPTLNEWGLIAMAGIIGLISLLAMRRKQASSD